MIEQMNSVHRHLITEQCSVCGKPVYADEGYYTSSNTHAKCRPTAKDYLSSAKKMDDLLASFGFAPKRTVKPVGQGRTATQLKTRIVKMVEDHYELAVTDARIWGQLGSYRGPKWDLAAWGMHLTLEDRTKVQVSSWSTMTAALKAKTLRLDPDGLPHSFDV